MSRLAVQTGFRHKVHQMPRSSTEGYGKNARPTSSCLILASTAFTVNSPLLPSSSIPPLLKYPQILLDRPDRPGNIRNQTAFEFHEGGVIA